MQHHQVDLNSYIGTPFRIRFRFNSGPGNFVAAVTPGWWVDDISINAASWERIASVPAGQTSLEISRTENGTYSYRVRGVYSDSTATAWSNVEGIVVDRPAPIFISDSDPAIEYNGGWHSKNDPGASNGVYHLRAGSKKGNNSSSPTARLVFTGESIKYFYATSDKGGTADVGIDGVVVATVSYAGTSSSPQFGSSTTFGGLGTGLHELLITHRSGTAYIDGFEIESSAGDAAVDSTAPQFASRTSLTTTELGGILGSLLSLSISTNSSDVEISAMIEGSAEPLGITLLDSVGNVVASGGVLLAGTSVSGVDGLISGGAAYLLQVQSLSAVAETLTVTVTITSRR